MRILIVNPNTSRSVTDLIVAEAGRVASPETEFTAITAGFGFPYIETAAEAAIAAHATLEALAENVAGHDAAIIAAFGDPGLFEAKQLLPIPVVGLAEAAMIAACAVGEKFSVITISARMRKWYRDSIERYGFERRFTGFRVLDAKIEAIDKVQIDHRERLLQLAAQAVETDGTEAVIFAGAPLAGFAYSVARELPVPAIDGTSSAVILAEALARMTALGSLAFNTRIAAGKPASGLSEALGRLF